MRIKEVARITGLTEKTIRFYEEKQLIHPEQTMINGRVFRTYSEHDIEQLNLVAGLRKLDFSISDIIAMRDEPERIPEILKSYGEKTAADLEFKTRVLERLKQINSSSVSSIRDLGEDLKEIAEDRPLPATDVELHFYRIDGLTREEMDREVQGYYERLSMGQKRKIRRQKTGITVLYIISVALILIAGLLTWRNTYYLGYIPSPLDNLGWKWILIPLFGLLTGAISYTFAKTLKIFRDADGSAEKSGLRNFQAAVSILLIILLAGIFVLNMSYKSLEQAKAGAAAEARQEWYELYCMADRVQTQYLDSGGNEAGGNSGFVFYVNQTCYNFPYSNMDRLHTRMRDLLIWCYDPIFRELHDTASGTSPEAREQLKNMLASINRELIQISKEILEKPDQELAELTRHDSRAGAALRDRINAFVDKYTEETEMLFRSIY